MLRTLALKIRDSAALWRGQFRGGASWLPAQRDAKVYQRGRHVASLQNLSRSCWSKQMLTNFSCNFRNPLLGHPSKKTTWLTSSSFVIRRSSFIIIIIMIMCVLEKTWSEEISSISWCKPKRRSTFWNPAPFSPQKSGGNQPLEWRVADVNLANVLFRKKGWRKIGRKRQQERNHGRMLLIEMLFSRLWILTQV